MSDSKPGNQRMVRQGGLMRCCLASLAKHEGDTVVGDTTGCLYEGDGPRSTMVVAAYGVWEWAR